MYYMGFTYRESYNMPIKYRMWFIRRTGEEINKAADKNQPPHHAAHGQDPDTRMMSGHQRGQVPARLRRMT